MSQYSGLTSNTKKSVRLRDKSPEANKLKMLSFPQCSINQTSTQRFILKNLSGIKTTFKLTSMNFEPLSHLPPA